MLDKTEIVEIFLCLALLILIKKIINFILCFRMNERFFPLQVLPSNAKPYVCGVCGSACSIGSNLRKHYKQFHLEAYLKGEFKDSIPAVKQICDRCGRLFGFGKDNLKRHLKTCKGDIIGIVVSFLYEYCSILLYPTIVNLTLDQFH